MIKIGVLKYAVLGLLANNDMSGYDIRQEFDHSIKNFWYAQHNQIYPELRKLYENKLVTYQIVK